MSFLRDVEQIIKYQNTLALEQLIFYHGLDLKAYPLEKDKHSRVYGRESGLVSDESFDLKGIIVNNDVIPVDDVEAGAISNGLLLTLYQDPIESGSIIEIPSDGTLRVRKFTVMEKQAYGQTTNVFYQYTLAAVG